MEKMSVNDLHCTFNMPKALKSKLDKDGGEINYGLPPYAPQNVYLVDEYPSCPSSWMHGSSQSGSYFVGVKEGHGMWLDFNNNFNHEKDVAVVLSIQGINPITGQKMVGNSPLRLEQYKNKCPIHNIDFQQDRFCPECNYKWPSQNYISTNGTPYGLLWIDGFKTPDGKVRQYYFTEDETKGVASQLIGDERVFAIGIAFYLSKENKKTQRYNSIFNGNPENIVWDYYLEKKVFSPYNNYSTFLDVDVKYSSSYSCNNIMSCSNHNSMPARSSNHDILRRSVDMTSEVNQITPVKNLEIGAGALINQRIYEDPEEISYWEESPSGMIYINYCSEETLKMILESGKRKDKKNGYLQGLNVGN